MKKSNYIVQNEDKRFSYKSFKWAYNKFISIYKSGNYKNLKLTKNNKILIEIL